MKLEKQKFRAQTRTCVYVILELKCTTNELKILRECISSRAASAAGIQAENTLFENTNTIRSKKNERKLKVLQAPLLCLHSLGVPQALLGPSLPPSPHPFYQLPLPQSTKLGDSLDSPA